MGISPSRSATWKWGVCGLLLLATMINYMDRLTLNQSAKRISEEFHFEEARYGKVEGYFGAAFAVGALMWGLMVDRINVRWVYPGAVILWSIAGMLTGFARNYDELLWCRIALGFFESANWPCALRTTQRLLRKDERTMGNSILQSGAAFGSIVTPFVVLGSIYWWDSWRPPFPFVGMLGLVWAIFWLLVVRSADLRLPARSAVPEGNVVARADRGAVPSLISIVTDGRFYALIVVVVAINATWHFFRAWLPLYLQKVRGFSEFATIFFMAGYYVSTDIGAISSGFATLRMHRRLGIPVHRSRMIAYGFCSLLVLLSFAAAYAENTALVLGLFVVMGFGALGVFPNYYSFSQELTTRHQGMLIGILSFICWGSIYFVQTSVGSWLETAKKARIAEGMTEILALKQAYAPVVAWAGLPPLIGFLALLLLWRTPKSQSDV